MSRALSVICSALGGMSHGSRTANDSGQAECDVDLSEHSGCSAKETVCGEDERNHLHANEQTANERYSSC
jgi:hypothetical protein